MRDQQIGGSGKKVLASDLVLWLSTTPDVRAFPYEAGTRRNLLPNDETPDHVARREAP
jgi:hypothetical protein